MLIIIDFYTYRLMVLSTLVTEASSKQVVVNAEPHE